MYYRNDRRLNPDGSGHQRPSSHGRHRRLSTSRLTVILCVVLGIETVLLIVALIRVSMAEQENGSLEMLERKSLAELESLQPEVNKLRQEIALLTQSRLPDLQKLEFDKVIELDKAYVRNIVFTVAGRGDLKTYEYKLVMHNAGLNLVHPQVDILLFDRVGVQVGQSRIGVQKDGTATLEVLDRGEIRSFSSRFELFGTNPPEYFRLIIHRS